MITLIWCIAKTIALDPQRRPSSKQPPAIASKLTPPPPSSVGRAADRARSPLSASIDSIGKRALRSTESEFGADDLVGDVAHGVQERLVSVD